MGRGGNIVTKRNVRVQVYVGPSLEGLLLVDWLKWKLAPGAEILYWLEEAPLLVEDIVTGAPINPVEAPPSSAGVTPPVEEAEAPPTPAAVTPPVTPVRAPRSPAAVTPPVEEAESGAATPPAAPPTVTKGVEKAPPP